VGRVIVLDTFPLSSTGKLEASSGPAPTTLDLCHRWIRDCVAAGHRVVAPAISYYEALRELERLKATAQIARLRAFCYAESDRYLSLADSHLELAAKLWADARNAGLPTAGADALDGDVILAAQALSLGAPVGDLVVATTNVAHLSRFVPAELWTNIRP
jgi:predicted nucleic acid-binding protein